MLLIGAESGAGPWEFGWEALVAIGTLLLAGATAFLALKTWNLAGTTAKEVEAGIAQAQAAEKQVAISQETIEASVRPLLVDVPKEEREWYRSVGEAQGAPSKIRVEEDGKVVACVVPLRNVGTGVARLLDAALLSHYATTPWNGIYPAIFLPPGEELAFTFRIARNDPQAGPFLRAILETGSFSVAVLYADLAGRQKTRLVAVVQGSFARLGSWRITRIDHEWSDALGAPAQD